MFSDRHDLPRQQRRRLGLRLKPLRQPDSSASCAGESRAFFAPNRPHRQLEHMYTFSMQPPPGMSGMDLDARNAWHQFTNQMRRGDGNFQQPFPTITKVAPPNGLPVAGAKPATVSGHLASGANAYYRVDVYCSSKCSPTGRGHRRLLPRQPAVPARRGECDLQEPDRVRRRVQARHAVCAARREREQGLRPDTGPLMSGFFRRLVLTDRRGNH